MCDDAEAPALLFAPDCIEKDGKYYLYFCMPDDSEGVAVSDSPRGPFTYRGILIDNDNCDPQSWNNHGSMECVNGQWYVFYHRRSRNTQQHRRLCVEKLTVLPDGSIPEVKMTSQGVGEPFAPGDHHGLQACEVHGGCYIDTDRQYARSSPIWLRAPRHCSAM